MRLFCILFSFNVVSISLNVTIPVVKQVIISYLNET